MTYTEIRLRELSTGKEYLVKVNDALTLYELNVEFNRQHNLSVDVLFYNNRHVLDKHSCVQPLFGMPDLRISLLDAYTATWTSRMILTALDINPYILVHVSHFVRLLNPELSDSPPNIVTAYIKERLSEADFSIPVIYTCEFQDPVTNYL